MEVSNKNLSQHGRFFFVGGFLPTKIRAERKILRHFGGVWESLVKLVTHQDVLKMEEAVWIRPMQGNPHPP